MRCHRVGHLLDGHLPAQLDAEGRHAGVADPARHDPVEPAEIHVGVDREPVHRDPAGDPDAERGDLAIGAPVVGRHPHAGPAADPAGGHAEIRAGRDQRLLDPSDVIDDVDVLRQGDDRVADQLAGAVEGDLAAAVDVDHRRRSPAVVDRPLVGLGAPARGVDRRVLEQQHRVGARARDARGVQRALALPGGEVVHPSDPLHLHESSLVGPGRGRPGAGSGLCTTTRTRLHVGRLAE